MAKMTYSGFDYIENGLRNLEGNFSREVTRKVLYAGAKVLEKEMKGAIAENHHVISGDMMRSVAQTEIHEGAEESWVEVYAQGTDSRGVSNEMKNVIINRGYYHKGTGATHKKDPYIQKMRKRIEPRILSVMNYQYQLTMKELGLTE